MAFCLVMLQLEWWCRTFAEADHLNLSFDINQLASSVCQYKVMQFLNVEYNLSAYFDKA